MIQTRNVRLTLLWIRWDNQLQSMTVPWLCEENFRALKLKKVDIFRRHRCNRPSTNTVQVFCKFGNCRRFCHGWTRILFASHCFDSSLLYTWHFVWDATSTTWVISGRKPWRGNVASLVKVLGCFFFWVMQYALRPVSCVIKSSMMLKKVVIQLPLLSGYIPEISL